MTPEEAGKKAESLFKSGYACSQAVLCTFADELGLDDNEILDEELITYTVLTDDGKCGIIKEIFLASPNNKILRIQFEKEVLIPLNSPMVKSISKSEKKIIVELLEGM